MPIGKGKLQRHRLSLAPSLTVPFAPSTLLLPKIKLYLLSLKDTF